MHFSFHFFFLSFTVGLKIVQQLAHKNKFERRKVHFLHEQDMLQTCHFPPLILKFKSFGVSEMQGHQILDL